MAKIFELIDGVSDKPSSQLTVVKTPAEHSKFTFHNKDINPAPSYTSHPQPEVHHKEKDNKKQDNLDQLITALMTALKPDENELVKKFAELIKELRNVSRG